MVKEQPEEWCVLKARHLIMGGTVTFVGCYGKSEHIENSTFKINFSI